ncbi:hypothetical protein [Rhizobium azibense]|nr:hypothetical protein [Rhizobium azibense]
MMSSILQAFEGEPKTVMVTDKGKTVITVEASHLRPTVAQEADEAAKLGAWLLFLAPLGIGYMIQEFNTLLGCMMAAGVVAKGPLSFCFRETAREVAKVRFTETGIEMSWNGQWRTFDRHHTHRFVLLEHDRTGAEKDDLDFQQRLGSVKGQAKPVTRYYSAAFIVAFEYFGQRFDIAEVMGRKEATAIVARLALCDEMMNGIVNSKPTVVQKPEDEWQELPGGLS